MKQPTKITALVLAVLLLGAVLPAYAGGRQESAEAPTARPAVEDSAAGFHWKAYSGSQIKFMANKHPWTDLIEPHIGEFEQLTGIKVNLDVYPEDQFRTKRTVELVSGTTDIDLFMMMPGQVLAPYTEAGWLQPLNEFMQSTRLLWPDYDLGDIYESSLNAGKRDGKNYTVPLMLETMVLAYNKDLMRQYGVSVPRTMEELEAAAAKIHSASKGDIYGITLRGKRAAATSCWVGFLHSFGGSWMDQDGNSAVGSEAAIRATEYYGRLLRMYGPSSAPNNSWYESISIFMQGKVAMIYDSNVFRKNYEDKEKSLVHDKLGYAVIPRGPAGSHPPIFTWSLGMYSKSRNKEAAWLFMQWATSKEMALRGQMAGVPAARLSAWSSEEFTKSDPSPEWTQASIDSFKVGNPQWNPPVIPISEVRDAVGEAIVAAILGQDTAAACKQAAEEVDAILKASR